MSLVGLVGFQGTNAQTLHLLRSHQNHLLRELSTDSKCQNKLITEGSLEVKLLTAWTEEKAEVGRVREEKRREEKRKEDQRRDRGRREKMQVRERIGSNVAKHSASFRRFVAGIYKPSYNWDIPSFWQPGTFLPSLGFSGGFFGVPAR